MVIKSVGFGGYQKNSVAFITPADLIVSSFEFMRKQNLKWRFNMEAVSYPLHIPKNVIEMYQKGRISLSRAAELMDTSTFEILRLAKELKIHTGATEEQQKKSRKTAKNLVL